MTTSEFSNEFDILYNSITSNSAPGLLPYEKSVLLTEAEHQVVIGLYNGSLSGESLEKTEELRRSLDSLIKTDYPIAVTEDLYKGLDSNSSFYKINKDVLFITYESVELDNSYCNTVVSVIPVRQDEYHKLRNNPFRGPNKRRVIRLDSGNNIIELISKYPIKNYMIRYLSRPTPIILEDLEEGLSIDSLNKETQCTLNPALHRIILERAVELASKIMLGK